MTNEHTLTLYSKGLRKGSERVVCERWVGDGTDCNILTSSSSDYSSTSFSFCWAAQPGVTEGHQPSVWSCFSLPRTATRTPTNWLQQTLTVCGTGLYNCLTSTWFLWASQFHRILPVHRSRWCPDIFDRMHLLFTQVHFLINSSVEDQYVTIWGQVETIQTISELRSAKILRRILEAWGDLLLIRLQWKTLS